MLEARPEGVLLPVNRRRSGHGQQCALRGWPGGQTDCGSARCSFPQAPGCGRPGGLALCTAAPFAARMEKGWPGGQQEDRPARVRRKACCDKGRTGPCAFAAGRWRAEKSLPHGAWSSVLLCACTLSGVSLAGADGLPKGRLRGSAEADSPGKDRLRGVRPGHLRKTGAGRGVALRGRSSASPMGSPWAPVRVRCCIGQRRLRPAVYRKPGGNGLAPHGHAAASASRRAARKRSGTTAHDVAVTRGGSSRWPGERLGEPSDRSRGLRGRMPRRLKSSQRHTRAAFDSVGGAANRAQAPSPMPRLQRRPWV